MIFRFPFLELSPALGEPEPRGLNLGEEKSLEGKEGIKECKQK